jgi:hypothetical protein
MGCNSEFSCLSLNEIPKYTYGLLMSKNRKACEETNVVPKAENMFSKVLLRLFPNIKKARPRSGEKRQYVYSLFY